MMFTRSRSKRLPMVRDRSRQISSAVYSHSIVSEPSKLLIRKPHATVPQPFTVSFTVKVRSIIIGAGLQVIRFEVTSRDLSTSIGS